MTSEASTHTLCSRCMGSFAAAEMDERAGERLCGTCLAIARRATRRAAAPDREVAPDAEPPAGLARAFFRDAAGWARGRAWFLRAPLVAYLACILVRHLMDPMYRSLFGPLNLGVHELGHFVFRPFGTILHAAGGTILQCLVPLLGLFMFRRQREVFGLVVAGGWLATNLLDVAVYVGDARAMALPLVTVGGGDAKHDWHYLLGEMGLLRMDGALEVVLRILGIGVLIASLAFGAWLVGIMVRTVKSDRL